jgi:hypothetical protein
MLPQYNSGDGIHLNNAGHRILFEQVKRADILRANSPLSIDPINFSAVLNGNKVSLELALTQAGEIDSFKIERSGDARTFSEIIAGNVISQSNMFNYSYTDHPSNFPMFYRCKVLYKTGDVNYSSILEIKTSITNPTLTVFPNPLINNSFSIGLNNISPGKYSVILYDEHGKQIDKFLDNTDVSSSNKTISINKVLVAGLYRVVLIGNNGIVKTVPLLKAL